MFTCVGYEGPMSTWSENVVKSWLGDQKITNGWDFDVDHMASPGAEFSELTEDHLIKLADNTKAGIFVSIAKEKHLREHLHKEMFPEFHINNYELRADKIPGLEKTAVSMLDFDESADIDPPFIIDHCDLLGELGEWVRHATEEDGQHKSILVLNGLVKTGKTAALRHILPQMVRQHEPNAEFCHLDFENFMTPNSDRCDVVSQLLTELEGWARTAGFPVPGRTGDDYINVKHDVLVLMNIFRASERKIYFLIDEVQRFFQVKRDPDHVHFKAILQIDKWNGGVRFAFTGSGMVRAWTEIAKCPANGTTVGACCWAINLRATDPPEALDHVTEKLLLHYKKKIDDKDDLHKLLINVPSIAGRTFLVKHWIKTPRKLRTCQVWDDASLKYEREFRSDMLPLLKNMESLGKTKDLIQMRKLAQGDAEENPKSWIDSTLHLHFFQHYIYKSDNDDGTTVYSFADTPFATLVMQHIGVDGGVLTPYPMTLFRYRNNRPGVEELTQSMGEHLAGAIVSAGNQEDSYTRAYERVEEVTKNHFQKYDVDLDLCMPDLLNWKNNRIKRLLPGESLEDKEWDASTLTYPYCAFLYAMRNAWSHPLGRSEKLTNQIILEFLPSKWYELIPLYECIKKEEGMIES